MCTQREHARLNVLRYTAYSYSVRSDAIGQTNTIKNLKWRCQVEWDKAIEGNNGYLVFPLPWLESVDNCQSCHWLNILHESNTDDMHSLAMSPTSPPPLHQLTLFDWTIPLVAAAGCIFAMSLIVEPKRRQFNAIFVAGAGAAYLGGGLGFWEFAYTAIATYVAYRGLESYRFIAIAWLMHSSWDFIHHLYGNPIIPFARTSSIGCMVCDAVLAAWFLAGAPSVLPESLKPSGPESP